MSGRLAGWLLDCALLTYCPQDLPNYIWAGYAATMLTRGTERLITNIFTVQALCQSHQDHPDARGTGRVPVPAGTCKCRIRYLGISENYQFLPGTG